MCFKSPPQSEDGTWLSNLVLRETPTPCSSMRWGSRLGEMRTEGRNWQPPIISLCSCWRTVSSLQECVTELQSAIHRQVWFSCSSAKQSWSQKYRLFPLQIFLDINFWIVPFLFLVFYIKWCNLKREIFLAFCIKNTCVQAGIWALCMFCMTYSSVAYHSDSQSGMRHSAM